MEKKISKSKTSISKKSSGVRKKSAGTKTVAKKSSVKPKSKVSGKVKVATSEKNLKVDSEAMASKKIIAIVTGAGNGMGKDFAKLLDSQGFDEIWAIAYHEESLDDLKCQMRTKTVCMALDLSDMANLDKIDEKLKRDNPSVMWLINAAGFGKFDFYSNIKLDTSLNMIDLNCKAIVKLTDICLKYMGKGARIVDFSSISAFNPVPYGTMYAATKAFILSYARGLNQELKPRNISITCVCPFWVKTKFFNRAINPKSKVVKKYVVMYPSDKVVKKAFNDAIKRKELSIYGTMSNIQVFMTKVLPASVIMKIWLKQQKLEHPKKKTASY